MSRPTRALSFVILSVLLLSGCGQSSGSGAPAGQQARFETTACPEVDKAGWQALDQHLSQQAANQRIYQALAACRARLIRAGNNLAAYAGITDHHRGQCAGGPCLGPVSVHHGDVDDDDDRRSDGARQSADRVHHLACAQPGAGELHRLPQ